MKIVEINTCNYGSTGEIMLLIARPLIRMIIITGLLFQKNDIVKTRFSG